MTSLVKRVLKGGSLQNSAFRLVHGHLLMSTMATQREPSDNFLEATTLMQVTLGDNLNDNILDISALLKMSPSCPSP